MSFAKKSQMSATDELDGKDVSLEDSNDLFIKEGPASFEDHASEPNHVPTEVMLEIDEGDDVDLTLDGLPGADDQSEIIDQNELAVEEPEEEIVVEDDPWAWQIPTFLTWLSKKMKSVPRHSGRDEMGIERAIAYLEHLKGEMSKACRKDLNSEIAADAIAKAHEEIHKGLERLHERLELVEQTRYPKKNKKKKKADVDADDSIVKEAQKATHVGGIVVTAPLFISYLARVLINGMVSAGHDIEDMYKKLDGKYKLTDRERAELLQLMADMGYPVRRDRGLLPGDEDEDGFDWATNYSA